MSESQTVRVPLEIPQSQQRRSLHSVRMGQSIVNSVAAQAEAPPPLPYTTVEQSQPAQSYQPRETYMQDNGNQQPPQTPQRPDPSLVDWYDPAQVSEYHRQDDAYVQSVVDARIEARYATSRQAQNEAEAVDQYNRTVEKYGADENFKSVMEDVLQLCARDIQTGKPLDIEARYREVSESTSRRPDQRLSHLPTKAKTVTGLGQLIEHNHRTGRAKPFGNRNWRG